MGLLCCSLLTASVASRAVASSSSKPAAHLHTSAPLCIATEQRRQIRAAKQRALEKRREVGAAQEKPHVILGHKPDDEAKWTNCDLAKVIITEQQILAAPQPSQLMESQPTQPEFVNYGIGKKEKKLLFEVLPVLSEESNSLVNTEYNPVPGDQQEKQELYKTRLFSALIDLRNANAAGIAFENKKRIIAAFSRPGKPDDSGLPEVQGVSCFCMPDTSHAELFT